MMDLKNLFSGSFFFRAKLGCATPKENINRISAIVDEEHFLVFCLAILSIRDTELPKGQKNVMDDDGYYENFQ